MQRLLGPVVVVAGLAVDHLALADHLLAALDRQVTQQEALPS